MRVRVLQGPHAGKVGDVLRREVFQTGREEMQTFFVVDLPDVGEMGFLGQEVEVVRTEGVSPFGLGDWVQIMAPGQYQHEHGEVVRIQEGPEQVVVVRLQEDGLEVGFLASELQFSGKGLGSWEAVVDYRFSRYVESQG